MTDTTTTETPAATTATATATADTPATPENELLELKKTLSKRAEHFSPDDWKRYHEATVSITGIPATPDEYQYTPHPNLARNVLADDPEANKNARELAKRMNLSNQQAAMLFDSYNSLLQNIEDNVYKTSSQKTTEVLESLKKEWGGNYDLQVKHVDKSIDVIADITKTPKEAVKAELEKVNITHSPALIKLLAALGQRVADAPRPGYNNTSMSRASATIKYNDFKANPDVQKILANKYHPEHKKYAAEFSKLSKMAFGEKL
jgi:hypothetical protein